MRNGWTKEDIELHSMVQLLREGTLSKLMTTVDNANHTLQPRSLWCAKSQVNRSWALIVIMTSFTEYINLSACNHWLFYLIFYFYLYFIYLFRFYYLASVSPLPATYISWNKNISSLNAFSCEYLLPDLDLLHALYLTCASLWIKHLPNDWM